ncbi:ATP-binding protein [Shimazuella kribbensis]|uniref:ATP-binding protein n=1 Tax=Shimazuella kribbensis TaxID=139808 RepID=UPI000411B3C2|nr:sensor histidine kinase [Shimazuella kribbensis]
MKKRVWKLESKMVAWTSLLILFMMIVFGAYHYSNLVENIEEQIGERALSVAHTVAEIPEIKEAFTKKEPAKIIQPITVQIRKKTGAEYIVVGNKQGIRYSHPYANRIGKQMVGGDNAPALKQGKSYISKAVGSLGSSLRGKVPIRNSQGDVIGVVSVGFLTRDINQLIETNFRDIIFILLLFFLIGTLGSFFIAKYIKMLIFGLEPSEISTLLRERNAVLESVREGIIAINAEGKISMINQIALEIFEEKSEAKVLGEPIQSLLPNTRMLEVLKHGKPELDREVTIKGKKVIVNRLPIFEKDQLRGVVTSFRLKADMDQLNYQLSQVKEYVEAVRAQTHEYKNTLYTISGLIQLESYKEALQLIQQESEIQQDDIHWLNDRFRDPWLEAILIGFYNRAREMKVHFSIDKKSQFTHVSYNIPPSVLVTILGNLINNAIESVQDQSIPAPQVELYISDESDQLFTFMVSDNGKGISTQERHKIYQTGYSTKEKNQVHSTRGYGLSNVVQLLQEHRGMIDLQTSRWGGACFIVTLPKTIGED